MRRMMPKTARTTRKKGQPRRRVRPLWRQPSLVSIAVLAAAAMSGGGSWWLWQTGWVKKLAVTTKERLVVRTAQAGFSVSEIFVEGRIETEKAALLASLQLDRGAPILSFDLKQARARVPHGLLANLPLRAIGRGPRPCTTGHSPLTRVRPIHNTCPLPFLKQLFIDTHTNTHVFEVCHGDEYLALVELLGNTTGFTVDGAP